MSARILVVIPTYNEAENIGWIVEHLHSAQPDVDVLIADDGSPDGTGDIADRLAETNSERRGPAPQLQAGSRFGISRRVRVGHRARL